MSRLDELGLRGKVAVVLVLLFAGILFIPTPSLASFRLHGGTFGSVVLSVQGGGQVLTGQINYVKSSSIFSTPIPLDFNGGTSFTAPLFINFNSTNTQLVMTNADAESSTQVNLLFRDAAGADLGCASATLPAGGATFIDLKNFFVDVCP